MKTVVVKEGDTLWSIAARELGDGKRWPEIFTANEAEILRGQLGRINSILAEHPDLIFPGLHLNVPDLGE